MRAPIAALALVLALPALSAQNADARPAGSQGRIQLAPRKAPADEAPARVPAWRTFAAAEAAARERHVLLLLYFTAKW
jgi:hypothetical protein